MILRERERERERERTKTAKKCSEDNDGEKIKRRERWVISYLN